jgi:hypothetical protein
MRNLPQRLAVLRNVEAFQSMLAGCRSGTKASALTSAKLVAAKTPSLFVPPSSYSNPFIPGPSGRQVFRAAKSFRPPGRSSGQVSLRHDPVDQAPFARLLSRHEMIAVQRPLDVLITAPAMLGIQPGNAPLGLLDLLGMNEDI